MSKTRMLLVGIIACLLSGCIAIEEPISPQQQLGYDLLDALKNKDQEKFKQLFAQKQVRKLIDNGLEKNFLTYKQFFYDRYGEFEVSDFHFNYQGSDSAGKLFFFYKHKRKGEKLIIWQHGRWVFAEF